MNLKTLTQGTTKYILALFPYFLSLSETVISIPPHSRVVESLNARRFMYSYGFRSCTRKPNFFMISKYTKLHALSSSIRRPKTTWFVRVVVITNFDVTLRIPSTFSWSWKPNIGLSSSCYSVCITYWVEFDMRRFPYFSDVYLIRLITKTSVNIRLDCL